MALKDGGRNADGVKEEPVSPETPPYAQEDSSSDDCRGRVDTPRRSRKQTRPHKNLHGTSLVDKQAAQIVAAKLKNILKLPKAHRWVLHEWFYSSIDKPIFEGDNDFVICLRESFPQLKTYKLTRVEWNIIRKLLGKPRRCSNAFFREEREALEAKRDKIRALQQRAGHTVEDFHDLPDQIPMPLVIGTRVTARLRHPHDGLFTGTIDALDTVECTYRIRFERPGLGSHSVPDFEVFSEDRHESVHQAYFYPEKKQLVPMLTSKTLSRALSPTLDNDPLLTSIPCTSRSSEEGGMWGNYPAKLLAIIIRLSKILDSKEEKVNALKTMNTDAERKLSVDEPLEMFFQSRYACIILELEKLNKDLNRFLTMVQQCCQEMAPEHFSILEKPKELRRQIDSEARDMVQRARGPVGQQVVKQESMVGLLSDLTALVLLLRTYAENEMHVLDFSALKDLIADLKTRIDPANLTLFQNCIEVHVQHIQASLTNSGNLSAFLFQNPS